MKELTIECQEYIEKYKESNASNISPLKKYRFSEINISEVELFMLENKDASFKDILFMMIDKTDQRDSEVYKRARIDRRLFSKIRSIKKYIPSKKTVIALCLSLELTLQDANVLLSSAGYTLSKSDDFDLAILFFISKMIYDFDEINDVLYELGFDLF